jgi:hypothetical protein
MLGNLLAVVLKEGDLIGRLIELLCEDDVGPDGEAGVVIEQLIGEDTGLAVGRLGEEAIVEPLVDAFVHIRSSNIEDLGVGGKSAESHLEK